ncbi:MULTISPECIES: HAD-IIIC family phosphatase [Halocynthiibacter]|uniref:HAD family hydrolase n=1 Tax=Halocynthiibacter halioticoli TaxID=2986804 RepID=A0AAE3J0C2_9RHOB|nr:MULTISPECIES: HAD family hydrolase [Halocynthiibacter]MCV6825415.1 HAD family hydrolase [Halocynthiibacter halioticoli]MCW4058416.1 HAD family hydrolase [Halocynthiibacter sp. SDUM655004]
MTNCNFPWRPPLAKDWAERLTEIEATLAEERAPDYSTVKTLANQQLGRREQLLVERLAKKLKKAALIDDAFAPMTIGLLGNRTLSYLPDPLAAAGLARGLSISSVEAPYDSVASFAFSPANCFAQSLDAVLVVLNESALASKRPLLDVSAEKEALADAEELFVALASAAKQKTGCPAIFATLPAALQVSSAELATPGSSARFRQRINLLLAEGAIEGKWLLWDQAALASRVGLENWLDPVRYHAAKIPFSLEMCPLAADNIASILAAMKGKSARGLILDLDNTLWGGVIGDDGLAGIKLGQNSPEGEAFVAFQNFVLGLRERGVVLAVCSKNTDEIAREPFREHSEMVIKEDHIAVFQANWSDKATNIKSIAETLSLGLESFVFIDDNAAERERVRQELPLVSTIEVGEDPSFYIERIAQSGQFDHLPLNTEDISRAESYGGRAAAAEIRAKIGNYDDYLTTLEMRMTISPFDDVGRARITQLINKSNQFNLTTRRYGEEDVRAIENDPDQLGWQVRLDDKFAQHGMIGVVIVRQDSKEWMIDTWLQSCRVLERGVEQRVMDSLFEEAAKAGVENIVAQYIPTDRNKMVSSFYSDMGFNVDSENDDGSVDYSCSVQDYEPHRTFIDVSLEK